MGESKLLKVTGIIMIIGGGLMLLIAILGLLGGSLYAGTDTATGGLIMLISIIGLIIAAIELIAGIMGVKNWKNPSKASGCFKIGIALIVLSLLNNLASVYISGFNPSALSGLVLGLILPVLYTYGAAQLKKRA